MSPTLPRSPAGEPVPDPLRIFRFLNGLPGQRVTRHEAPWQKQAPDFLLLDSQGRALLLKISPAGPGEARPAAQLSLLDDHRPPLGEAEEKVLSAFLNAWMSSLGNTPGADLCLVTTAVLFPRIPQKRLDLSRPAGHPALPLWLGRECVRPKAISCWQEIFHGPALDALALTRLRSLFSPELDAPAGLAACLSGRAGEAGAVELLLNDEQEIAMKAGLGRIPQEDQVPRLYGVSGPSGSGKTLVLLCRLRLLLALHPRRSFLVLAGSQAAVQAMQAGFRLLAGRQPAGMAWESFSGWCRRNWPPGVKWLEPLEEERRRAFTRAAWLAFFKDENRSNGAAPDRERSKITLTAEILRDEIDWIKSQVSLEQAAYLATPKSAGGLRLDRETRARIFLAYQGYQRSLKDRRVLDERDVTRRLWEFLRGGRLQPAQYDFVLVDQAESLSPLGFAILRRLVKPTGQLFVACRERSACPGKEYPWKLSGLDLRGPIKMIGNKK
jgi:hypothetical protein